MSDPLQDGEDRWDDDGGTITDIVPPAMSDRPPLSGITLRDRIAAVITEGKVAGDGHGTIADAVIRELQLEETDECT
jgi:hypothetical protein